MGSDSKEMSAPPYPQGWVMTAIAPTTASGRKDGGPCSALFLPPGGPLGSCCGKSSLSGAPHTLASQWKNCSHCFERGTGWTGPRTAPQSCKDTLPHSTFQTSSSAWLWPHSHRAAPSPLPLLDSCHPGSTLPLNCPVYPFRPLRPNPREPAVLALP